MIWTNSCEAQLRFLRVRLNNWNGHAADSKILAAETVFTESNKEKKKKVFTHPNTVGNKLYLNNSQFTEFKTFYNFCFLLIY